MLWPNARPHRPQLADAHAGDCGRAADGARRSRLPERRRSAGRSRGGRPRRRVAGRPVGEPRPRRDAARARRDVARRSAAHCRRRAWRAGLRAPGPGGVARGVRSAPLLSAHHARACAPRPLPAAQRRPARRRARTARAGDIRTRWRWTRAAARFSAASPAQPLPAALAARVAGAAPGVSGWSRLAAPLLAAPDEAGRRVAVDAIAAALRERVRDRLAPDGGRSIWWTRSARRPVGRRAPAHGGPR